MKSVLLMILIVFALPIEYSVSHDCPASCIVCMENATICQGLTYILATPLTTRALLLTDGLITSVCKSNLTRLSSLTLLRLSNNGIVNIKEDAFYGLSKLRTLLLDQNEITKYAITESTFTGLSNLQTLQMDNNALSQINGTWFKHMVNLISLQLRGNQITKLEANIFRKSSLYNLQILDLSYNFIRYIDRDAFQALRSLEHLDLSRNRISVMPDSFSHLSKLSVLNLDLNHWNCTCELKELSLFLRNFIKSPDRTLINAKDLVCEATESSAIQTLFQLTDANCVPSSENITIILKNEFYRQYVRDIALAAVFCFAGAVVLTIAIIAVILHKKHQQHIQPCQPTGANISNSSSRQNHIFKEFSNGYDNEVQVVSTVSSADERKLLEQNIVGAKSREDSKQRFHEKSIGHLNQVNQIATQGNHFICHNCKLVHSFPVASYGNISTDNEVKRLADRFSGVAKEQREVCRSVSHWKDIQTKSPRAVPMFNKAGIQEGRRPRYKHFDGSYCPLQKPSEKHYREKEYHKWIAETKDANQSQMRRQIKSQYNDISTLSPTNKPQKSKTVALIADEFHEHSGQLLQENRAKIFPSLPGNHLIGNHEDQNRLISYRDGIQVIVNKMTKTKQENNRSRRKVNEKLSDNVMRSVDRMDAKGDRFAEEERRSKTKVGKTKQPQKQKVVTFKLPDFHANTAVELTPHETNAKEEGKGRTCVASSDGNRKLREEKTHPVRPCTAGKRSHKKEKESDIEEASLDNKSTGSGQHKMSKKKLMVKLILDPTKQATVCPDEAANVKQPSEKNKQNAKTKKGLKDPHKKVKTARKATASQSNSPPVNLVQHDTHHQKPADASNYTLATFPNDTQCQLNATSESDSRDRLMESNEKFHTVLIDKTSYKQHVAKTLQSDTAYSHGTDQGDVSPSVFLGNDFPVTSTETNELINSVESFLSIPDINTTELQESQRSMESNEASFTPSEMSGNTVAVKNMNYPTAPFPLTCPNNTAFESPSTERTHVDDNEKKDTLLQLKSSTVGTIEHQNVTLDRNNRDLKLQNDQYSSQVSVIGELQFDGRNALKISERQEQEDYNKQSQNGQKGCEDTNQSSQIEGSIQMPVSEEKGNKEHKVQTVNEQSGVRGSVDNKVIMKDTAPEINMKEGEEEHPLNSVVLLSGLEEAASSDNNQITGLEFSLKSVDLPSDDRIPHSVNDFRTQESLEECSMEPASEIYLNPLPTEQYTATSSVGPKLENQDDATSIIFNNPNINNSSINASNVSHLQTTGVNKDKVSDIIVSNAEKPEKQVMVMGDLQPVNCNLLPIHNSNILDEVNDQENQKTKIRIVIPEQPNGQSRNLHNRKIR